MEIKIGSKRFDLDLLFMFSIMFAITSFTIYC